MVRIPTHAPPVHPGEVLVEDYLRPLGMTQVELAKRIKTPFQRVNAIVRGHRAVTPDTALRLAKLFDTTPDLWLNLQQAWDLYQAAHSKSAAALASIEPVRA
jgi:antitoxin HigA-1